MAWPTSLPAPLIKGYGVKGQQSLRRTAMEAGPDRVQRVSDVTIRNVSFRMIVTTLAQRTDLMTFYNTEANGGADWVTIPIDTGLGIVNHRVRFTAVPAILPMGNGNYSITCPVETDELNQ